MHILGVMADTAADTGEHRVSWYRVPLDREVLRRLTARSDTRGLLQTGGYLGLLAVTGAAGVYSLLHLPVLVSVAILLVHGTFFAFMINAFHELVHGTMFRSKWLNGALLRLVSFVSWNNHVLFRASHTDHHGSTLHPPHDPEVMFPLKLTLGGFLLQAIVSPPTVWLVARQNIRFALGLLSPGWEADTFPKGDPKRRRLFRFARIMLLGHAAIVAGSIVSGLWPIAVVTTAARFYGSWLFYLCNNTQHIGLRDNVPDFRLCCRTIALNPFVRFLYFQMNYHAEHHMYAAVPCYNLARLRRAIAHAMPEACPSLAAAWREIAWIQKRQKVEPAYQHGYELPAPTGNLPRGSG